MELVARWEDLVAVAHWAVVFVDHGPAERRKIEIENFRDKCELMVVHDTEDDRYGYPVDLSRSSRTDSTTSA